MLEKDHISGKLVIRLLYIIDCKYIMSDQKKYNNFMEIYRKAYPDLQKGKQWWLVMVVVVEWLLGGGVLLIQCFERLREGVYQNRTSANKGEGGQIWSFCNNVITECPLYLSQLSRMKKKPQAPSNIFHINKSYF